MPKVIDLKTAKHKQLDGIRKVVDAMAITIGPRGKNVCLSNGDIVNDGKRIAEDVVLKDPIENKGATKVRNMVRKISSEVGGGRTACAILYKELCTTGLNLLERGFNANLIKKGMQLAVKDITAELDKMAKPVKGKLKEIATISTESEELGKVIADTIEKVGLDSVVTVEESNSFGLSTEIAEGLKFDKGYISPYMVTNERLEAEYKDIPVLITDKKLSFFKDLQPIFDTLIKKSKKELFIIAEDLEGEALNVAVVAKLKGQFNTLAIKTPGIGDNKKFCIEDLCALTGAELWTEYTKEPKLGKVKKVVSKKDSTIIMGGNVDAHLKDLAVRRAICENKWEIDQYDERIAKLKNGIAVIKVGAASEDEVKYLKLKIEDGVNETKRALEEGIVMGGNVAFIQARRNLKEWSQIHPRTVSHDEGQGLNIVWRAVEAPLRQIIENSGGKPDWVIPKILELKELTAGYNAWNNTVDDDMYKLGIIDAVKVVKSVLQYAVSEAAIFLSIGGDISEEVVETK
jgi:chaperonin GroEL